jgi:carbonic anhydrase/acetyltransferase-like protein (isoleucine patch superfamily)
VNAVLTRTPPHVSSLYRLGAHAPLVAPDAWIAPSAILIGQVEIGPGSGIWFGCVLRADTNLIKVGARTNIQDGTVIHVDPGEYSTIIGDDVTIGHSCLIHGCKLESGAFVGMASTILNGAVVEGGGVLGAGSLLTSGKRVRRNELWTGSPAQLRRTLTDAEREEFMGVAAHYANNAQRFMRECAAMDGNRQS